MTSLKQLSFQSMNPKIKETLSEKNCHERTKFDVHCFERLSWPPIDKSHVTYVMMLWQRIED